MIPNSSSLNVRSYTMNIFLTSFPVTVLLNLVMITVVLSDAQINRLNSGCSQYNATNSIDFFANRNETFHDLRAQISNGSNRFATAQRARTSDPVYGMVQCRNYLSRSDCVSCFTAAVANISTCSAANGARVIYDGCFLRYESSGFFNQTTLPGNAGYCSNQTGSGGPTLVSAITGLLTDLVAATPRIDGYFAASTREVSSGGGTIVYAIAQCANTVEENGCKDCLNVAYNNIQSCPPGAEGRAIDAGCFLRYSDKAFFDTNKTTDLTPFLRKGGSSIHKGAIIGISVGGACLLLFVVMLILWIGFSRRNRNRGHRGDILGATELRGPITFNYKDLSSATKKFSEENKLGEGGFGDVYKGILKNGKVVAIKKLAIAQTSRAKADFESEVRLISNVHHRNLIRLLGCCSKRQELLVYEYMANSSLDKFLFGEQSGNLNWKQRFNIILGTARGLAYLHEEFHACIIHRDIKSSNILLDDEFQPKIADFGLARLLPEDQSHLSTKFAGTLGYTAPEYAIHGQLSVKVDTYSYGVVVLEIISGRKCNDMRLEPICQYLLEWAWILYEDDKLMDLVDQSLDPNDYRTVDVKKVLEIALLCTQSSVVSRPTMSEVVVLLLSNGAQEYRPTRPVFIDATKRVRGDTSTSTGSSTTTSVATISVTENSGR